MEKRQRRSCIYACLMVLALLATHATATNWWLLGVSSISTSRPDDPLNVDCNSVASPGQLTPSQKATCNTTKNAIRALSVGIRRGIVECQRRFSKSLWNCTTFDGSNLFGAFINNHTRETAVVNVLLTAGAARSIAEGCREEQLRPGCTCQTDGKPTRSGKNFTFHDCNADTAYAETYLRNFVEDQNATSVTKLSDNHNIMAGLQVSSMTTRKCRCHGTSGTCTLQTCYRKSPEMEEIGQMVRSKYTTALQVKVDGTNNNALVRKDGISTSVPNSIPVYVEESPNFCVTDFAKGTIGTAHRQCQNTPDEVDNCGVLCCQRGAYFKVTELFDECCEFVWCCRIECRPCNHRNVTEYFCNP